MNTPESFEQTMIQVFDEMAVAGINDYFYFGRRLHDRIKEELTKQQGEPVAEVTDKYTAGLYDVIPLGTLLYLHPAPDAHTDASGMVSIPRSTLWHWLEYWNGSLNEKAMSDALYFIEDQIKVILKETDASGDCSGDDVTKYPNSECEAHHNVQTSAPVCIVCMDEELTRLRGCNPQQQIAHTDHPMRHYNRTCPGCNAEQQSALFKEWMKDQPTQFQHQGLTERDETIWDAAYAAGAASREKK